MFASLKRLFGRNTQTQERRWYEGPQPVEQLFEEYLASAAATKLDKRADELMHGMSDGSIGEEGWREMVELAAQGSMLARYHSAILLIWSGDPSEQEAETSMQLLQELAELNFMPAIAALCALVTPEELVAFGQEKIGQEEFGQEEFGQKAQLRTVVAHASQGSVCCTLLWARTCLKYPAHCCDTEDARQLLAKLLLHAATTGSLDALRMLCTLEATCIPGIFDPVQPEETMALLTEAAGQGHADIMVLLGRAYLDGIRTERDEETAAQWFEKAVAAGSLDACSELAALYMGAAVATEDETQQRSLLTQAKTLLDAGCAHNHAPSMVNLVRCNFLTDPAGYETEEGQQQSLALLHKAAELGETEPYLDVLFRMLDLSDTDSKRQELLALLEEPILEGNAAARLRLHQFGLAQPGLSAEEAKQTLMSAIGAIAAQDKYGPACAFLAEVYAMGMYEQEGSDELAREYIDLGRELRNPRCVTLDMLLEQGFFEMPHVEMPHDGKQQTDTAAAQAEAASAQQSAEDEAQRARLRALSLHGERMATVHLACRNMMLDREEAWFFLRVQMKTREVRQMIAEFARSLATWVREAMEEHDYGFVCYLALEFLRAARGTLNKELALACVSAFGLELEEGADRNEICLPHVALTLLEMLQDAHVVVLPENAGERGA